MKRCGYIAKNNVRSTSAGNAPLYRYSKLSHSMITRTRRLNGDDVVTVNSDWSVYNDLAYSGVDKRSKFHMFDLDNKLTPHYIIDRILKDNIHGHRYKHTIDAVSQGIDVLRNSMVYESISKSNTFVAWVAVLNKWSSTKVVINPSELAVLSKLPAQSFENFGMTSVRSCLDRLVEYYNLEYYISAIGDVTITREVNATTLNNAYLKLGVNLSSFIHDRDYSTFANYGRGFGAYIDPEDESKGRYESEFSYPTSISDFGKLPIEPMSDERFTNITSIKDELKKRIDATILGSYTATVDDSFYNQVGANNVQCGNYIILFDKNNPSQYLTVRIFEIVETYDDLGILHERLFVLGDYSPVYKDLRKQNRIESKLNNLI